MVHAQFSEKEHDSLCQTADQIDEQLTTRTASRRGATTARTTNVFGVMICVAAALQGPNTLSAKL
jgi:hypothetical protein